MMCYESYLPGVNTVLQHVRVPVVGGHDHTHHGILDPHHLVSAQHTVFVSVIQPGDDFN